jgi:hypothetical protein
MNYLSLFKKVGEIRNAAKKAHQLALSNHMASDDVNTQFEKLDKKLFSFERAVIEVFNTMKTGDYEYVKPSAGNPHPSIDKAYVFGVLKAAGNTLETLRSDLKGSKYKVVDKHKNEYKNLSNGIRSLLTKAVTDMDKTLDLFAPEESEEK